MIALGAIFSAVVFGLWDHRTGRIPNYLTVSSWGAALLARTALEGSRGLGSAVLGTVVVSTVPALFFFLTRGRAIGGGDVKALAALGGWLGPFLGLEVELLSLSLLALSALVVETWRGRLGRLLRGSWCVWRLSKGASGGTALCQTERRFGPYLAVGTMWGCAAASLPAWLQNL